MLVLGLFAQALGAGAYFFVRQLGEFYAVAAVFGLIYGGIMPLYAVIAREYFPMRIMGTVIGASTVFSSGGMALGPAVGGWIYDTTGSYGWLYIASFGIGLGAMAIALLFPPFPRSARWRSRLYRSGRSPNIALSRGATSRAKRSRLGLVVVGPQARRHGPGRRCRSGRTRG